MAKRLWLPANGLCRQGRPSSVTFGDSFSLRAKSRLRRLRSDTRLRAQPLGGSFIWRIKNHDKISRGAGRGRRLRGGISGISSGARLLTLLVSALMGLAHPGASLAKPLGFSGVSAALFQLLIGLGAIVLTLVFLLKVTRLKTKDLRIMLPAPWSPGFCLPVFLGVANLANLAGALINRLTGSPATSEMLPSGGPELLMQFLALCVMPAIAEELLFRGAFQA